MAMVKQMIETTHQSTPRTEEKLAEKAGESEELMLLPTLGVLSNQLSHTVESLPGIKDRAKACLKLIARMKGHRARYDPTIEYDKDKTSWYDIKSVLTPKRSTAKVTPSDGYEVESNRGHIAGSKLTGKEYIVPLEELQELYTYTREIFLTSVDVERSWHSAMVVSSGSLSRSPSPGANDLPPTFTKVPPSNSGSALSPVPLHVHVALVPEG